MKKYDFSGWATRNDIKCADGRVIRRDAFIENDGCSVPLVWMHQHDSPFNVLGHADLENRPEGVYAYCSFNDTEAAQEAKKQVEHGDIKYLSIWANKLKQKGSDVIHGAIKEVSLVLAGANPGASIESLAIAHSDGTLTEYDDEGVIYNDDAYPIVLAHADTGAAPAAAEEPEDPEEFDGQRVFDSMTEDQKTLMYVVAGKAAEDASNATMQNIAQFEHSYNEGEEDMHNNIFDNSMNAPAGHTLSHDDMKVVIEDARRCGSFRDALKAHMEEGVLAHSIDTDGMDTPTGTKGNYGIYSPDFLFPDYKSLNNPPEFISRDMSWVDKFMNKLHHTPFSRIKSVFADITEDEARAKGYVKGNEKVTEIFSLLKRTTDPQTVYKLQKFDRDDVLDITDFDVIAWIRREMRMMLNEEVARAILIGDGRLPTDPYKIQEAHIRPIFNDVDLFTIKQKVPFAANATPAQKAKAVVEYAVRGRKGYKGSGNPTFYTTEDWLTEMLLLEDGFSHRLYKTEQELATAMRVSSIETVEVMEGLTRKGSDDKVRDVIGVIVNPNDYNVGADKGGAVENFDDFDIKFNQYYFLIETRFSGALTKPYSAITLEADPATTTTEP